MICVVLLNTLDNMVIPELGKIRAGSGSSVLLKELPHSTIPNSKSKQYTISTSIVPQMRNTHDIVIITAVKGGALPLFSLYYNSAMGALSLFELSRDLLTIRHH